MDGQEDAVGAEVASGASLESDESGPATPGGRLPNLIIAGFGKAGTTSLFWYLSQHPDVCASSVKEPRYFRLDDPTTELPPLDLYARHFSHCGRQRYVMEASPQYVKGGERTIGLIKQTLGSPRILMMLRDPVELVWSEYRFRKARMTIPRDLSFDAYLDRCERVARERPPRTVDTAPYWILAGGPYIDHLSRWFDAFGDDIRVLFLEDMARDPREFVRRACGWLGIDGDVVDDLTFSVENRSIAYRSRTLHRVGMFLNSERLLRNRRRLKGPLRSLYYAINRTRPEVMSPVARARLQEVFAPSNAALARELTGRGYRDLPGWLGPARVET